MAKKIKPNTEFTTADIDENGTLAATPINEADPIERANESPFNGQKTAEDIEKITGFDRLCEENAKLAQEKSDLVDKMSEYINEIETLKASTTAKGKCDELECEVEKLKRENKALQDENDKYLMKISELTFENAKMTAQLNEMKTNVAHNTASVPPQSPTPWSQYKNVYRTNNGYTSWN